MKIKTRKDKRKNQETRDTQKTPGANSPSGKRRFGWPKWLAILAVIGVIAGVSFAAFDFIIPGRLPPELVGKWRVEGGPLQGMTIEFKRDGSMNSRAFVDGKQWQMSGTAEVDGKTLRTTAENPFTHKMDTGSQTIISLTESEFVTEDKTRTRITMRKVQ
jgi:uncharacterized protein (TIGR03066 family)